jgi:Fic-DOC domain mobile mystery protein B
MKITYPKGATPLDPDELASLLLPLTTQAELNSAEKEAIFECQLSLRKAKKLTNQILTLESLKELHRKMFSPVWSWAGKFRTTEKNIGVAPHQIQLKLDELCKNSEYRIPYLTEESWPEFAALFHHALVAIHPFPNGNGRHARLATEILSHKLKQKEPNWGRGELVTETPERETYISALKLADKGEFRELIEFMFK